MIGNCLQKENTKHTSTSGERKYLYEGNKERGQYILRPVGGDNTGQERGLTQTRDVLKREV